MGGVGKGGVGVVGAPRPQPAAISPMMALKASTRRPALHRDGIVSPGSDIRYGHGGELWQYRIRRLPPV
jgi:hypothetical protein